MSKPNAPIEAMSCPVISTAHLTYEEAQRKEAEWPSTCYQNEYGFIAYFGDSSRLLDAIDANDGAEYSEEEAKAKWPGLIAAAAWAEKHGFEWIRFDRDADEQPGLPTWEW